MAVLTQWVAARVVCLWAGDQGNTVVGDPPPTAGQIQSLIARVVENQHRSDRTREEFECLEHVVARKGGDKSPVLFDRTDLVMPSGAGIMRIRMSQNGSPVSPDLYRHELQSALETLDLGDHPDDRRKQALARFEKRRHDRAELVDAAAKAFRFTWAGREKRGGRTLVKLLLDPDPAYKPTSRYTDLFEHIHAVLWIDESQDQMVNLDGEISSDITFGEGVFGKVYHGGHFLIEQSEVASGVFLTTLYTYDVDGRKFLFSFGIHERTEVTRYRRVGPPAQSIAIIRNELNNRVAELPVR